MNDFFCHLNTFNYAPISNYYSIVNLITVGGDRTIRFRQTPALAALAIANSLLIFNRLYRNRQSPKKYLLPSKGNSTTPNTKEQELEQKIAVLASANQDLQENCVLMEKVGNFIPNIVYIYDLKQKCNTYSNRHIGEILGYSEAEAEQMNLQLFDKLLHPEDASLVAQHHQKCLTLGKDEVLEVEYRIQDRFEKWLWLHIFERDARGQPTHILGIIQDITETKQIQAESARLNEKLAEQVATLESWHCKRIQLAQLYEFLQACLTIEEANSILNDCLPRLFPNTHGVVYLLNNSKNTLSAIVAWGLAMSDSTFEPTQCWALRRSCSHMVTPQTSNLHCTRVRGKQSKASTLCLPMIAKGKNMGMLHLRFNYPDQIDRITQELAETLTQNIALSFANLTLQRELRHQSMRDPLTGLYNRRYLQESLAKEIDRARRKQQFIGIMMLDIDHFKIFNDTYGHIAGERILQEVSTLLRSEIRQYDIACRYGGEELMLVLTDASIEKTILRAEDIRQKIKELELQYKGQPLKTITVSIGVSCFPDDGTTPDEPIDTADKALYTAKEGGRDRVKRY